MIRHENAKIVAFVGLAGSGKSSAVDYVTAKGYPKVYFGGVVLKALDDAGLEHTADNEKAMREGLREREGKDVIAKRIIDQLRDLIASGQHRIVADGLYTWTEYKLMKRAFPGELTTLAVVTPKHLRHHRLTKRPIRPLTDQEANDRDWSEIENLEKGGPIAIADHYVINDGSLEKFHQDIDRELEHIDFYS